MELCVAKKIVVVYIQHANNCQSPTETPLPFTRIQVNYDEYEQILQKYTKIKLKQKKRKEIKTSNTVQTSLVCVLCSCRSNRPLPDLEPNIHVALGVGSGRRRRFLAGGKSHSDSVA